MTATATLVDYADSLLEIHTLRDFSPNGLQVGGREHVERLMTGVTACQALLDSASEWQADAVVVHHGWFWKNEPAVLTGMRRCRVQTALDAGFNLLAYHLPLDIHRIYGNNAELARLLDITVAGRQAAGGVADLLWFGRFDQAITVEDLTALIAERLDRTPLHLGPRGGRIESVAWCSGAGADFLEQAAALGVDAFITGEASERTTHIAREAGIHCFVAGHHATERQGVRALGEHLAERFDLAHRFVDIDNPM